MSNPARTLPTTPPPPSPTREIAFLPAPPPYPVFRAAHLRPLAPLIFADPALPRTWLAHALWTKPGPSSSVAHSASGPGSGPGSESGPGSQGYDAVSDALTRVPDVAALATTFRGARAPVVTEPPPGSAHAHAYGEEARAELDFAAFARAWDDAEARGAAGPRLYLKDFHLCLARPAADFYPLYDLFHDDWLNAHALHTSADDFRFLYLGRGGTRTALHADVARSHSWSTSLCGVKRWALVPPSAAHLLAHRVRADEVAGALFSEGYGEVGGGEGETERETERERSEFPGLEEARRQCRIVWQYPTETIFVPAGWYHEVVNYGPTLSINHNWTNASCLLPMYTALAHETTRALALLSDLRTSTAPRELHALAYANLVRPSWGSSFAELWAGVRWVRALRAAGGGLGPGWPWAGDGACRMEDGEERAVVGRLARLWLAREEAGWMPELRAEVEALVRESEGGRDGETGPDGGWTIGLENGRAAEAS